MSKVYPATGLTGGTTGCLDAIDGTDLADKDVAIVTVQDGNMYPYVLDADSAESESSPLIISPDANAGDKRWKLVGVQGAFSHVRATETTEQTITDLTITTLIYSDEDYDLLDEYNTSTGIFTAMYSGYYHISANVLATSAAWVAANWMHLCVTTTSGTLYGTRHTVAGTVTDNIGAGFSNTVYLTATNTAKIEILHSRGDTIDVLAEPVHNYLSIDRIA